MKNLFIGICEESGDDAELLVQHLKIAEVAFDMTFDIRIFRSGRDLLKSFSPSFDLLFIKVPLPDINSETLLSQISQCDSHVQIILTSESDEFYRLGYQCKARNYFTKPVRYRNIYHELEGYLNEENICRMPYLWVSVQGENYKLYLHKIRYIETSRHQLCFHYGNEKFYIYGQISDFENQLSSGHFFRCSNSYLVNANYIESIEKDISRYKLLLIT